ncbi:MULTISPECIES: YncE family protein [Streptomyces]|uniref:YncE family protein n=2 Tax=Streptomyces TaxID=1883 RepID=A0ABU4KE25_9ACTN|nr:YncE family protein [Streptomyces roseolus]MDX2295819.1 YncE family protein [Streptomyces roseolus]
MTKIRRPSRTARAVLPAAVAAVLLAGCAEAAETPAAGAAAPTSPTVTVPPPTSTGPAPSGTKGATAVAPAAGTLLVADFGSDTVTFVDPARGSTGSVRVGTAPYGLALGKDGRAWVATAEGVAVVDTAGRRRLALVPYRTDTGPVTTGEYRGGGMGIALAPDGKRAYVGVNVPGGNGTLEVIDTASLKVVDVVEVGRRPFDVDVSRDGSAVYATNHDSFDVTVVDADSLGTRRVEVAPYGTEGGLGSWLKPHYTAVRPSDGKLLLPFEGERLAVVDPATGRVEIESMTANTHQHGATVTPDGTLLAVGTGPIDPDEDRGPSLTVRSPGGAERVYPLDGPHEDVAVSEDGRTAYVTGGFTRDGYWDGISVVDLGSGEVTRLAAGSRPLGVVVL